MFISLARVAYMYYEQELTQQQIASRLKISRIKVSRLLKQAREAGVVRVQIDFSGFFPDLELALCQRYPGTSFVVTDSVDGSNAAILTSLGNAAAEYLRGHIRPNETVAVGWGRTLMASARAMEGELPGATFVPLIGGRADVGLDVHANSVAATMAANTGSTSIALFSPALAHTAGEYRALMESPAVSGPIARAAAATTCVFSVGSPDAADAAIGEVDYYSESEKAVLRRDKAVCDIVSIAYYNSQSERVAREVSDMTVSLSEAQLLAIPRRICVAGGPSKRRAIEVCLNLGLATTFILDDVSARSLLGR